MTADTKTEQWQLVPTEPTPAMLAAAFEGMVIDMDVMRHVARTKEMTATYARMIAAAPSTSPDAQDAARYRWLRSTTKFVSNKDGERIDVRNFPLAWDEAIDAAIKGGE